MKYALRRFNRTDKREKKPQNSPRNDKLAKNSAKLA